MSLTWNTRERVNPFAVDVEPLPACRFHYAESAATDDATTKDDMEVCLELASTLLNTNVKDESLYFMVEWDSATAVVRLAVTDCHKANDAPDVVVCRFASLLTETGEAAEAVSDKVRFWVKDYLSTTNGQFMNYSLVALFTPGMRAQTQLL